MEGEVTVEGITLMLTAKRRKRLLRRPAAVDSGVVAPVLTLWARKGALNELLHSTEEDSARIPLIRSPNISWAGALLHRYMVNNNKPKGENQGRWTRSWPFGQAKQPRLTFMRALGRTIRSHSAD